MPEAVAAVMARDPAPGDVFAVNDPFRAAPTCRTSRSSPVPRPATPCRARTTPTSEAWSPRACRPSRREISRRVSSSRRCGSTARCCGCSSRTCATRTNAAATCGPSSARRASPSGASQSSAGSTGAIASRRRWTSSYAYSERRVRAGLRSLPDGVYEAEDVLEPLDGELEIRARVTVAGDEIEIDFAGTRPSTTGNLNCPLGVTRSACYFVVRVLTAPDIPATGGAYAPVPVLAPEGCLVNAGAPAAVVAGNTETSSRITDIVFRALGQAVDLPAQGQGTMNNLTFGSHGLTYYETIGGGQGACPESDGPSASTSRCRTPSTHRSRRSSSPIRSACAATSFVPARAGTGATAAATASYARSRCWRPAACRSSPSAEPTRRREPRAGRRASGDGTSSTGRSCRPRPRARSCPATSSGSRRPAAGASAPRPARPCP